jgi:uncharacterized membrane protein
MSDEKPNPPNQPPAATVTTDTIREQDKIMLVLAYLGLLSLVPLLAVKDSEYVKWHARQGLALFILWFGAMAALWVLTMIPFLGILFFLTNILMNLGMIALVVIGIVKAFGPERWKIPLAADLAPKLNI